MSGLEEDQPQAALNRLDMAIHNAGILRTESVHIQAPDARAIAAYCARSLSETALERRIIENGMAAYWQAGHRTDQPHDCFVMNCNGLIHEVEELQVALVAANRIVVAAQEFIERPGSETAERAALRAALFPDGSATR